MLYMNLLKDAFCRVKLEMKISYGLIMTLILMVSLLLSSANAETKYIYIHWDNNTVKLDGKYTIELRLDDNRHPPPQPFSRITLARDIIGQLSIQLGSDAFLLARQTFALDRTEPIVRPQIQPVVKERHARMNINYHDDGKNIGSKAIPFSII